MKKICMICELWLVRPVCEDGHISYWCTRCSAINPGLEGDIELSVHADNAGNSWEHGDMSFSNQKRADGQLEIPFLFRLSEVERILSLSRTSVYRQIKSGKLGSVRIGRSVRVSQSQLQEFIQESS